jgi:hypothetical protein
MHDLDSAEQAERANMVAMVRMLGAHAHMSTRGICALS